MSDEQLLLIDVSRNHNLPSVLFEFIYPAACCHLRSSSCLFSKFIGPPLVVSLETGGGAYLQTLEKKKKKQNKKQLEIKPSVQRLFKTRIALSAE